MKSTAVEVQVFHLTRDFFISLHSLLCYTLHVFWRYKAATDRRGKMVNGSMKPELQTCKNRGLKLSGKVFEREDLRATEVGFERKD